VNAAVTVDSNNHLGLHVPEDTDSTILSNNILGLHVPEDTGNTILSNVGICVFTKLQRVTFEKSPEAIKGYVCTCRR
jgi:hypothetical protein